MALGSRVVAALPAVAVVLGLGHAALLGGLSTPVAFTRAVLAIGVLCPLMMTQSPTGIGRAILHSQSRLLPLLVSLTLGPALALALGRWILTDHPEQRTALLLLSVLPGSALAPVWAAGTRACGSAAVALMLIGWLVSGLVGLPLFAGPLAPGASFLVFRDFALLGVAPLALGSVLRTVLADAFDPDEYAVSVEPARRTVLHASVSVLLFFLTASDSVAEVVRGIGLNRPAFAAVALLYLGLFAGCGMGMLACRHRCSTATARALLQVTSTRQTVLVMSLLPLTVAAPALSRALAIPLIGLVFELVLGTVHLAFCDSRDQVQRSSDARHREGCPSIVPE